MKDPYFGPVPHKHDDPLARLLSRLAWLMDRAFTVPGTKVQFGLDALIGVVPLGGDVLTGLVQAGLVLIALGRYRVPPAVAAQMMANVLLDVGVGAIPLLGDLFDVAFKANTRNMVLLEPFLNRTSSQPPPPTPSGPWMGHVTTIGTSWGCIVVIALALLAALTLVLIGFVTVVRWILRTS